jgi:signal transduction histidine kinase
MIIQGGQLVGFLYAAPLILIAWIKGQRAGLLAAVVGIVLLMLIVLRNRLDSLWIVSAAETSLGFLVIGAAVGKLGESLRELSRTADARLLAEKTAREAEKRCRDLIELAPQYIAVIQDSKFVLCSGNVAELMEDRHVFLDMMKSFLEGSADEENATVRFLDRNGKVRWFEFAARRVEWDGRRAGLLFAMETTAGRLAEQALEESHGHLEATLRAVPDLLYEVDTEGRIYELLAPWDVSAGKTIKEVLPPEAAEISANALAKAVICGKHSGAVYSRVLDGEERWYEQSIAAIEDCRAPDAHFVVLTRDITERRRLEEQVAHAKKMEAVGRLAGGIAHDFNNILQAILGFCELIRERVGDQPEVLRGISLICDSARRAASLTHRLLAFSRTQILHPVVRDLNDFIRNSEEALRRCLGKGIELFLRTEDQPIWVSVDPAQLLEVILSLAANARDFMQGGGRLSIRACHVEIGRDAAGLPADMAPGSYAVLDVKDSGIGMDRPTLSHLFEPFFTTRDAGQGLGLSIVYGTIRQMGGFVSVDSVVGLGTRFSVHLPMIGDSAGRPAAFS